MTEIEKQIIEAIIGLLRDGGQYAVTGLIFWFGFQILRTAIIGGFLCLVIRLVSTLILKCLEISSKTKKDKISLISEDCSRRLTSAVTEFSEKISQSMTKLETQVKDLKMKSNVQQQTLNTQPQD